MDRERTVFILKRWIKRLSRRKSSFFITITFVIGIVGAGAGLFIMGKGFLNSSLFSLSQIEVKGINRTRPIDVVDRIGIHQPINIFDIDLYSLKKRIESLPWVKACTVRIKLPNAIFISIEERKPFAILHWNHRNFVVDDEGVIIITCKKCPFYAHKEIIVDNSEAVRDGKIVPQLWEKYVKLVDAISQSSFKGQIKKVTYRSGGFYLKIKSIPVDIGSDNFLLKLKRLKKIFAHARTLHIDLKSVDINHKNDAIAKVNKKNIDKGGLE